MINIPGNNSANIEGIPKDGNYEQMAGDSIPTFTREIKLNSLKMALSTLLLGGFYAVLLAIAISTEITMLIALTIAVPISLGAFIGLLYWFNRNYS